MSLFDEAAPAIIVDLMLKFDFTTYQAAAILGNIGTESAGLQYLHQDGGYGWCRWTGPRGKSFLAWCTKMRLDWHSDEANFGYLVHELEHEYAPTVAAVLKAHSLAAAVRAFERNFERAGVPAYAARDKWAARALRAYRASIDLQGET